MELLKQHGLYGSGLVEIDSPLLVGRYNECLAGIGQEPTQLHRFHIDGRGWSPEVAEEKQNTAYLSHGGAVQFALLLTPEQIGKPIHRGYFSFERVLLGRLFEQAGEAVARITKRTGLWLQMDPGFSEIQTVNDLAQLRSVTVTLGDPLHLVKMAERQQQLVKRFLDERQAWMETSLRAELVTLGQKFGDLRFGSSFKASFRFGETSCFYAPSFGGTFVFQRIAGHKDLLVVTEKQESMPGKGEFVVSSLQSRTLYSSLVKRGLIDVPLVWYCQNPKALVDLREGLLVSAIYEGGANGVDFTQLNEAQRERYAIQCRDRLSPEFSSLERLRQRLANSGTVSLSSLSVSLKWLLARPAEGLPAPVAEVVWKLICRIAPVSVLSHFSYDKETFFPAFGSWPEARQRWAVESILSNGIRPRRHL